MLRALFSGMHRYTRSSKYVDRKAMKRTVRANRPGGTGFSFTGEFESMEAQNWKPVEAANHRASYMQAVHGQGVSEAVGREDVERLKVFTRFGVRMGTALVMFVVFGAMLSSIAVMAVAENAGISKRLAQQMDRMETLDEEASLTQYDIALRSNDVNIRQEAIRIGMTKTRGMDMGYLQLPDDAVIDPVSLGYSQDMASIWGQ